MGAILTTIIKNIIKIRIEVLKKRKGQKAQNRFLAFSNLVETGLTWNDMDRSVGPELHDPSTLREKSIIGPDPDKVPGMVTRPALTDDDAPRCNRLPAISLYAQALGIGVSSVRCTSLTFCMCHVFL